MYELNTVHTDSNSTRESASHPSGPANNDGCASLTHPCTASETHQNSYENSRRPTVSTSDNSGSVHPHEDDDDNDNDDNPDIQQYHVTNEEANGAADMPANSDTNASIQPYAVKYQEHEDIGDDGPHPRADGVTGENGQPASISTDDVDIKPYAAAYMDQDDTDSDIVADPSSNDSNPSDHVSHDRKRVPNALQPNPMYVPNVQHGAVCERHRMCSSVTAVTVLVFCVGGGLFLWPAHSTDSPSPTATMPSTSTLVLTGCCSSVPTPPAVSNSSQCEFLAANRTRRRKMQTITFGERGREPGKFEINYGVAVSADNEIFVTDLFNRRVQIFSMNGTYLRLFPTAVPGERRIMYPFSVAIDVEPGYLWVVGSRAPYLPDAHAIQYSKYGLPIKKFDLRFMSLNPHPSIAIDVRNNDVIVGEGDTMMMFQPNGSPFRSFEVLKNRKWSGEKIGGVASDRGGNILLTDSYKAVRVYNRLGDKILEFGKFGRDEDQLVVPHGVCVDQLGRIIVANWGKNRVDMFTSRGEFVRTVASIENPWGVTIGPDGQLVSLHSDVVSWSVRPSPVTTYRPLQNGDQHGQAVKPHLVRLVSSSLGTKYG
uniref:SMP-30/Gluconolactonase/LRE-like region domain-containing protein n=1 Tax=Branchiostoma floridae TaxID=7739 RepID=C3Z1N5_BRAFL|eukprot:XP_002597390.1 hypothetical protein BRAFLDRAFT_69331 [Branchiostoma floridae]